MVIVKHQLSYKAHVLSKFGGALLDRDTDDIAYVANFVRTYIVNVPTRKD